MTKLVNRINNDAGLNLKNIAISVEAKKSLQQEVKKELSTKDNPKDTEK